MAKKYHVFIKKGEDGFYVIECLDLPGCISQGKTREDALSNIQEAIQLYLETLKDRKIKMPEVETVIV